MLFPSPSCKKWNIIIRYNWHAKTVFSACNNPSFLPKCFQFNLKSYWPHFSFAALQIHLDTSLQSNQVAQLLEALAAYCYPVAGHNILRLISGIMQCSAFFFFPMPYSKDQQNCKSLRSQVVQGFPPFLHLQVSHHPPFKAAAVTEEGVQPRDLPLANWRAPKMELSSSSQSAQFKASAERGSPGISFPLVSTHLGIPPFMLPSLWPITTSLKTV